MKSRIKIVFQTDSVHDRTHSPMVIIFYYKTNSDVLFYKELIFNVGDMRKIGSESAIDHLEKGFDTYEKILHLNQFKASSDNVLRIFNDLIIHTDNGSIDTEFSEFSEIKNKLMANIRKNKIRTILNTTD